MNDDDELRTALRDAVSGVQPRRGLESIEERIGEVSGPGRVTWISGTAAAVAAVIALTAGVAYFNHRANEHRPVPATAGRSLSLVAYYLGETATGPRLFSERHDVNNVTTNDAEAALDLALGSPDDPDYHAGFPAGTTATASDDGNTVVIDFDQANVADPPASKDITAPMAIQALAWTISGALNRPVSLSFRIDGKPAPTILGEHLDRPVAKGSADDDLSPVSVDLAEGSRIRSGSPVTGEAAAYEGTVVWELRQGERVVQRHFTTAAECCTLAPYSFVLKAPPGGYTLVVHDTNASGREGYRVTSDTKDIVVLQSDQAH